MKTATSVRSILLAYLSVMTLALLRPVPGFACDPPFGSCLVTDPPPQSALASPAASQCPTSGASACVNWNAPLYCVNQGGVIPPFSSCTAVFTTIQTAITAVSTASPFVAGQTILVTNTGFCNPVTSLCSPPPVYNGGISIPSRLCLRATPTDFWNTSWSGEDLRWGATIQSNPLDFATVLVQPAGSGSCIQDFKLEHRGNGPAVNLGSTNATVNLHVNNVSIISNLIDVTQSTQPVTLGVNIAGLGNKISRNVIVGRKDSSNKNIIGSAGVQFHWTPEINTTCASWDGNEVNGNHITSFENGIQWLLDSGADCSTLGTPWNGNRMDLNDISDCGVAIRSGAGAGDMRLLMMQNKITAGAEYGTADPTATPPTFYFDEPDRASQGIQLGDSDGSELVSNSISGVQIGIHLAYTCCHTRVQGNEVFATSATSAFVITPPTAVLVCPSHCNWLIDNELSTDGNPNSIGVDFSNRQFASRGAKPSGSHFIDGGVIHDVGFVTHARVVPGLTFLAVPVRKHFGAIDLEP